MKDNSAWRQLKFPFRDEIRNWYLKILPGDIGGRRIAFLMNDPSLIRLRKPNFPRLSAATNNGLIDFLFLNLDIEVRSHSTIPL